MSIYPIFFIIIFVFGTLAAFFKGPIWGLVLYVFVYFNIPNFQWWGAMVPNLRWSFTTAGILLVSCFIHSKKLVPNKDSMSKPLISLILLLFLMALIVPISYDPSISLPRVYDYFRYVLVFYLIGRIVSNFKQFHIYLLVMSFCYIYLFWTSRYYFTGRRLDGVGLPDAAEANAFAILVIMIVPILVALVFTRNSLWLKMFCLIGIVLAIDCFAMTRSRGSFVGLLVQAVVSLILLRKSVHRKKIFLGLVGIAILSSVLMDDQFKDRILRSQRNIMQGDAASVSAGRIDIWKSGIEILKDYPLGAGGGGFMALSPKYIPEEILSSDGTRVAHNLYLQTLTEQGLIGLLLYLSFIILTISVAFKALRIITKVNRHHDIAFHLNMLIVSVSGFWVAAFFGDRLYFEGFYLIAALIPVLHQISRTISIQTETE